LTLNISEMAKGTAIVTYYIEGE